MKHWLTLWCLLLAASLHAANTQVRLVLSLQEARPGDTVVAGIQLKMNSPWHTYWVNAGDSGMPTKVEWELPEGMTAGEIAWPVPEKDVASGLTTYIYRNEVWLQVPLKIAANAASGTKEIKAKLSWLECAEACVPGKGEVQASLTIGGNSKASPEAAVLEMAAARLPKPAASLAVKAYWEKEGTAAARPVIFEIVAQSKVSEWDFFPYGDKAYDVDGAVEKVSADARTVRWRKLVKKSGDKWPEQLAGLVVGGAKAEQPSVGYETKVSISAAGAPTSALAMPTTPSGRANASSAAPRQSLPFMLGLAFLGGLILNIMPCVLPVIALKILGFVNQSRDAPGQVRKLGLLYGVGVLASFLVLAGLVIIVQQAGKSASWGMQFQNAQFLVAITVLVVLVTLNLFGLFEVNLSGSAMGAAGQLATRHGASGAFFNGVLATALATPCTAPFLGVALGFAFVQSPVVIVLMFLTVGLGLAAPYMILSWKPAWLKFLPRPGAWMEKFKIAMGFPMLATAIWLFSLAAPDFGKNGAFWLGMMLVVVALAAWIWGAFIQRGSKRKGLAWVIVIGLLVFDYAYILEGQLRWRSPVAVAAKGAGSLQESPDGISWGAWSAAAVEQARQAGKPVLVDFTADWCATCQVNKKTSLEIASVRAKLKAIGAVALLGDFTQADPLIAAELKRYGRAGVPLVLVYPKDANAPAIVLPEFLTPGRVLEALEKAGK